MNFPFEINEREEYGTWFLDKSELSHEWLLGERDMYGG